MTRRRTYIRIWIVALVGVLALECAEGAHVGWIWHQTAVDEPDLPWGTARTRYGSLESAWQILCAQAIGCGIVVWLLRRTLRARRIHENLCVRCGYDLRASAHRCPECGTPIPTGQSGFVGEAHERRS